MSITVLTNNKFISEFDRDRDGVVTKEEQLDALNKSIYECINDKHCASDINPQNPKLQRVIEIYKQQFFDACEEINLIGACQEMVDFMDKVIGKSIANVINQINAILPDKKPNENTNITEPAQTTNNPKVRKNNKVAITKKSAIRPYRPKIGDTGYNAGCVKGIGPYEGLQNMAAYRMEYNDGTPIPTDGSYIDFSRVVFKLVPKK